MKNSKMEFTKSPWFMNTTKRFITDKDNRLIAEVSHDLSVLSLKEYEANAKLIAAAPELLEALQAMLSRFNHTDENMMKANYVKRQAMDAIKKATE